jgi:hypothetical protein
MVQQDVSDGEQIILEKPERGAKDGYLVTFFNSKTQLNRIIAETNGVDRVRLMTLSMIASMTDDTIRQKTFDYFDMKINEINASDKSADEKNQAINDFCCGPMQGHITSYYDQFLGISHRLKLGTI